MKTLRCLVDRVELQLALDGDLPVEAVMARASVLVAARELLREARALVDEPAGHRELGYTREEWLTVHDRLVVATKTIVVESQVLEAYVRGERGPSS